jgi:hypothetical protein
MPRRWKNCRRHGRQVRHRRALRGRVHQADEQKLEDGTPVKCKRRGLKIVFNAGGRKGEGLMRRLAMSAPIR